MSELTLSLWRSAPLDARLRFASELLPAEDALQPALKEAVGVVQFWRRGSELEAWAKAYPSLVVDTAIALEASPAVSDEAHIVAAELLRETRGLLDASLRAFGFEWVSPKPGDTPSSDYRWEGEGVVVAVVVRLGLRHNGALLLPAEVRLGDSGDRPAVEDLRQISPIGRIDCSAESPDWLRALQLRGANPHLLALEALASAKAEADDGVLLAAVAGLREAVAGEEGGPSLRSWLQSKWAVDVLQPNEGEAFDPMTMQAVSERRTVHEHEADTVARLERSGFAREGRVLAPAEVVRYVAGEAW